MMKPVPLADKLAPVLESRLPEKTLRHTLSVAAWVRDVCEKSGHADELRDKAVLAALFHDLCKPMLAKDLLAAARDFGITITPEQEARPMLLHGPVAAWEAKTHFGVTDPDVFNAIFYHTTGCPGLGPAGLTLYFCDFSEPLRTYPEAAEARALFDEHGLDAGLLYVARNKLDHVKRHAVPDPLTESFIRWLEAHGQS